MADHARSDHCECRACTCDCGAYQYAPQEKCHIDCRSRNLGLMSEHEYPDPYLYRITYF